MNKMIKLLCLLLLAPSLYALGSRQSDARQDGVLSVLVFIPGMVSGSPTYELLVAGAESFASSHSNVTFRVYEAGFNQAEWEEQLTSLVASGNFDLVLSSNPSLPEICERVGRRFPNQRFIITDADFSGNSQIATYLFNQYEQSLFLGYLAGLITTSNMEHANQSKLIGFIAAQEYPLLTRHIVPGFIDGARMVDPEISLDMRVIGNWFDANRAADLASSMITAGVDVFGSIAGNAGQGIIRTAQERGAYMVFHNTNAYASAPGIIVGSGIMQQKKLVEEILADVLAGRIQYGTSRTVGVREGYIDFISDDPGFTNFVPQDIRDRFMTFMENMRAGRISYTVPQL